MTRVSQSDPKVWSFQMGTTNHAKSRESTSWCVVVKLTRNFNYSFFGEDKKNDVITQHSTFQWRGIIEGSCFLKKEENDSPYESVYSPLDILVHHPTVTTNDQRPLSTQVWPLTPSKIPIKFPKKEYRSFFRLHHNSSSSSLVTMNASPDQVSILILEAEMMSSVQRR